MNTPVKKSIDTITIRLTPYARATIESIGRSFETDEQVINRILDTLLPTADDFDHFYGEPRDGKGASGS